MTRERIWIFNKARFALEAHFRAYRIKKALLTISYCAGLTRIGLLIYPSVWWIVAAKIVKASWFGAIRPNCTKFEGIWVTF